MNKLPIKDKFKHCYDLVWYCLRKFSETRGDDRTLFLKVWDLQGFRLPKKLIPFFYKVHSPESIRRTRQKIQSEGLYLPDSQRVAERSLFCMANREMHRGERMTKKYKWVQKGKKKGAVIICEVDGKDEIELLKNYAKMVWEMTKNGWKPHGWSYKTNINF